MLLLLRVCKEGFKVKVCNETILFFHTSYNEIYS